MILFHQNMSTSKRTTQALTLATLLQEQIIVKIIAG